MAPTSNASFPCSVQPVMDQNSVLVTEPKGKELPLRPAMTSILFTHPFRAAIGLLMKTQCPAVIRVRGDTNQPVPIQVELSRAVMSNDAIARHGYEAVSVT